MIARLAPAISFARRLSTSCEMPRERGCPVGNAATATRSGRGRSRMRVAPGIPGMPLWPNGSRFLLHAVDELHELGRAREVADARVGVGIGSRRRVAAQREEARDARVEELAHEAIGLGVARPDAREVRHRLDVGVLEHVAQYGERPVARRAAGPERHRDEGGADLGEAVDRAPERQRRGIRARREELERDRRPRPTVGAVDNAPGHAAPDGGCRGVVGHAARRARPAVTAGGSRGRVPGSAVAPGGRHPAARLDQLRRYAGSAAIRPPCDAG